MRLTRPRFGALILAFLLAVPAIAVALSPFVDVIPGKFHEAPVNWAVSNAMTTGRDATHFAPEDLADRPPMLLLFQCMDLHVFSLCDHQGGRISRWP